MTVRAGIRVVAAPRGSGESVGVGLEFLSAVFAAEIVCAAVMLNRSGSSAGVHVHVANRILDCVLALGSLIMPMRGMGVFAWVHLTAVPPRSRRLRQEKSYCGPVPATPGRGIEASSIAEASSGQDRTRS